MNDFNMLRRDQQFPAVPTNKFENSMWMAWLTRLAAKSLRISFPVMG